ncbi:MAG: carbohydrate kinase [Caldithrix sp.]|nr:carbohydrate kinase [Caldithrix sp.]
MRSLRPIIFGEVLFDVFDTGSEVLGGAPFNVAWHLQGFGLNPLMISRIGKDERGKRILRYMKQWQMDLSGMQQDDQHPTGIVSVQVQQGQPTFDIVPDQAYDFIDPKVVNRIPTKINTPLIYHGSLALRQKPSTRALNTLITRHKSDIFVDINLRDPWWSLETLDAVIRKAHFVKLNDAELRQLAKNWSQTSDNLPTMAKAFMQHYDATALIVTLGAEGAFMVDKDQQIHHADPVPVAHLKDTVGAGDAFSAVSILGFLQQWPFTDLLQRAMAFASAICSIQGATTTNRALYQKYLKEWGVHDG